jgi:hypothetical protein
MLTMVGMGILLFLSGHFQFPGHSPPDFEGVGGVDAEKYHEDFGSFGPGQIPFQQKVLFVSSEAALQTAGPLLGIHFGELLA